MFRKIISIHDEKFSAAWAGGEHLSADNMNKAIEMVGEELNISIPEFTVAGVPYGIFFHKEQPAITVYAVAHH